METLPDGHGISMKIRFFKLHTKSSWTRLNEVPVAASALAEVIQVVGIITLSRHNLIRFGPNISKQAWPHPKSHDSIIVIGREVPELHASARLRV